MADCGGGEGGGRRHPDHAGLGPHLPRVEGRGDHLHLGAVVEDGPELVLVDGNQVRVAAQPQEMLLGKEKQVVPYPFPAVNDIFYGSLYSGGFKPLKGQEHEIRIASKRYG